MIKELKNDLKIKKINLSEILEIVTEEIGKRTRCFTGDKVPRNTGIYIFFNNRMEVMYIGKAIDLKARFQTHMTSSDSKVNKAKKENKENIKYYCYGVCNSNREAEMYEMIYSYLYNPKLIDINKDNILGLVI